MVKKKNFCLDKDWRHCLSSVSGGTPGECSQQPSRPIPQQPSVHTGLNCKVLAGGDAGLEQLREEPVGSQLTSLAPGSLQLVARLLGEEEESALPSHLYHVLLIPPHVGQGLCQNTSNSVENTILRVSSKLLSPPNVFTWRSTSIQSRREGDMEDNNIWGWRSDCKLSL